MKPSALTLFSGIGGGSLGLKRAGFNLAGAVDFDEGACKDYRYLIKSSCEQGDLARMTPEDLRAIVPKCPDLVLTSPPCKSFSGLLGEERSKDPYYVAMSDLARKSVTLVTSAWRDLPRIVVLENVPRIMSRGRPWIDSAIAVLIEKGYTVTEQVIDFGRIGLLAQSRPRYLLVAALNGFRPTFKERGILPMGPLFAQLPAFSPGIHSVMAWGEDMAYKMACVPVGKDWKAFPPSHRLGCSPRNGTYGMMGWHQHSYVVTGAADPYCGPWSIADPRPVRFTHKVHDDLSLERLTDDKPCVMQAPDGTWHRAMTTLELAALQDFPTQVDGEMLNLCGKNPAKHRERIGNAIPPGAAEAFGRTLLESLT